MRHACAAALVALGIILSVQGSSAAVPKPLTAGLPAPLFMRADLTGRPVDLKAYRGKVVLLDFWASWCAPCIVEIPHLIALQKTYGPRGLQVIGVSMDDSPDPVKTVMKRYAFDYPVLLGNAKFGDLYGGIYGLPVRFLVGPNGKILQLWKGELDPHVLDRAVRSALKLQMQ